MKVGSRSASIALRRQKTSPVRVALSIWRRLASSVNTGVLDIYEKSSIDLALKDAFRKMRAFLMKTKGLTEDEAISLISIAVDFGVTHGRRQLGHPRHHQEEPLHRRNGLRQVNAPDNRGSQENQPRTLKPSYPH